MSDQPKFKVSEGASGTWRVILTGNPDESPFGSGVLGAGQTRAKALAKALDVVVGLLKELVAAQAPEALGEWTMEMEREAIRAWSDDLITTALNHPLANGTLKASLTAEQERRKTAQLPAPEADVRAEKAVER